jgi:methyltransferase (TIGR00027 family)
VARARFIEDMVVERASRGVGQYVILGAGLDSFAQRRPEIASSLTVFEVDPPGAQAWKRRRLIELGFGIPEWLRLVPVDFEAGDAWWQRLAAAGFDSGQPAIVASTGVSMYLTKDAIAATLRQIAALAPGSMLAMTAARARGPRGASRASAGGEGRASKRDAFHQLLHAEGDAGTGPRSRLQRSPARIRRRSCPTLLRGQNRWLSPAK